MNGKIRKTISALLIMSILVINMSYCVSAAIREGSPLDKAIKARNDIVDLINNSETITGTILDRYLKSMSEPIGFIVGANVFTSEALALMFKGKTIGDTTIPSSATDDEVIDTVTRLLTNNITQENDTLIYNNNAKNIISIFKDGVENNSPFHYALGYNIQATASQFIDTTHYNKTMDLLSVSDNTINLFGISDNKWTICKAKRNNIGFVIRSTLSREESVFLYDINTKNSLYSSDTSHFDIWEYDSNISDYKKVEGMRAFPWIFVQKPTITGVQAEFINGNGYIVGYNYEPTIKVFNTASDLSSLAPYYINNGIYDSVMNSNNSYTITEDNSNNITYGDINNYNNANNPNDSNIQIFIDNDIPPTSGGGSGGGSGGSGSDGPTFDLGFLGTIGNLIGSLITGIGNLITGILKGIVNAFNSILEFLTDTIQDVGQNLPNQFFAFVGAMFNWLPEPMLNAFKALFLMMLFLGIFNLIKR